MTKQPPRRHYRGVIAVVQIQHTTIITPWLRLTQILSDSDTDSFIDDAIPRNRKKATAWGITVLKGKVANFKFLIQAN